MNSAEAVPYGPINRCEGVNCVVCGYGGEGVECVGVRVARNEQMQNLITQVCYEVCVINHNQCGVR